MKTPGGGWSGLRRGAAGRILDVESAVSNRAAAVHPDGNGRALEGG